MSKAPTRFGLFMQPLHDPRGQDLTVLLEQDLQFLELLDDLGYDEAWIGEHHSGGWEYIGAPDIFIAAAAGRTRYIRLGTGVTSVTYHHPLILADRMCLLDHLTRGRIMFGVGPGVLALDAWMLGIDPMTQRPRLGESLEAILALLRGEVVNRKTDWFTLQDAHLQLMPFTRPCFEVAVAGAISPSGARLAGQNGVSLLSVAATSRQAYDALANHWEVAEEEARHAGKSVSRANWRLTGPMHIAETEAQARKEVMHKLERWIWYYTNIVSIPFFDTTQTTSKIVDELIESGYCVIGTPDQAIARINALAEQAGGFGSFLLMDVNWTTYEAKRRSYELFAKEVFPAFRAHADSRAQSEAMSVTIAAERNALGVAAREKAGIDYAAERAARGNGQPGDQFPVTPEQPRPA